MGGSGRGSITDVSFELDDLHHDGLPRMATILTSIKGSPRRPVSTPSPGASSYQKESNHPASRQRDLTAIRERIRSELPDLRDRYARLQRLRDRQLADGEPVGAELHELVEHARVDLLYAEAAAGELAAWGHVLDGADDEAAARRQWLGDADDRRRRHGRGQEESA